MYARSIGRDAHAQVGVVGHRVPFHQVDPALSAPVPQDCANMITTWYLHSHQTWDRLCHSRIGSPFLPRGAFPEGGAYVVSGKMHTGSLEAPVETRTPGKTQASLGVG